MRTVLITGASEGLGLAFAKKYLSEGYQVVSVARHNCPVDGVHSLLADITKPEDIDRLSDEIHTRFPDVSILINNAGTLLIEELGTCDYQKTLEVIKLNLVAPLILISKLNDLILKNESDIVNICSTSGYKGRKGWGAYGMSRWGNRGLHENLKEEYHDTKVRVMLFSPPALKTDHFLKAGIKVDDMSEFLDPAVLADTLYDLTNSPKNMQVGEIIINKKPLSPSR